MSARFIYFIRPIGRPGPVKIGCSQSPFGRLQALMSWSPDPLEIVATIPGGFDLEKNIHECFAADHLHHEWFSPSERVVAFVALVASGVPVEQAADLSIRTKIAKGRQRPEIRLRTSYSHRFSWAERKLEKANKDGLYEPPADVNEILYRWRGCRPYAGAIEQREPNAEEIARLEEVLAEPSRHFVRRYTFEVAA